MARQYEGIHAFVQTRELGMREVLFKEVQLGQVVGVQLERSGDVVQRGFENRSVHVGQNVQGYLIGGRELAKECCQQYIPALKGSLPVNQPYSSETVKVRFFTFRVSHLKTDRNLKWQSEGVEHP